jgi:hypothetical protein
MNRALPPGDRGYQNTAPRRPSRHRGTLPGACRLVGRAATNREGATTASAFTVIKHGGFARLSRETPCAPAGSGKGCRTPMFLIDSPGKRPVCVACHRLGPYQDGDPGVFICDACVQAADAHLQELAETVPELRDHRLKRWRTGCDCERCRRRGTGQYRGLI